MRRLLARLIPFFEGEGGGSGASGSGSGEGGAGASGEGNKGANGESGSNGNSGGEKTLTDAEAQAKIDAAIKDRLAREKKKTDGILQKLQAQIDELSGKQPPAGGEGNAGAGNAEAEAAKAAAAEMVKQANQKVLEATAITETVKLGVDPKFASDVVKLADLSKAVKEDGTIDTGIVSKALDDVLKRVPAFKAESNEGNGGGFRVGGQGGNGQQGNGWGKKQNQGGQQESGKSWNRWNH